MSQIEDEIYEAAKAAANNGFRICQHRWLGETPGEDAFCCPLTALVLAGGVQPSHADSQSELYGQLERAADSMLPDGWTAAEFVGGFDGEMPTTSDPSPAWLCGRSVGRRLGFAYDDSWMEPDDERD